MPPDIVLIDKRKGNPAWVKGMPRPGGGRPPRETLEQIWQDPGPRAKKLIEKHGIAEIFKAVDDVKYAAKKFSSYDQMIIVAISNAMRGNGDERERLFNRMFGKVPDKTINLNLNVELTPASLTDKARAMFEKLGDDNE